MPLEVLVEADLTQDQGLVMRDPNPRAHGAVQASEVQLGHELVRRHRVPEGPVLLFQIRPGEPDPIAAVRVTDPQFANPPAAQRLMAKTATLMHRIDAGIPADLANRARLICREEFFGGGYGETTPDGELAIVTAREEFGLALESTYTGKAMAALLGDLRAGAKGPFLFWNTYNSRPMQIDDSVEPDFNRIPPEFARYFD